MDLSKILEYVDEEHKESIRGILAPIFSMPTDDIKDLSSHVALFRARGIVSKTNDGIKAAEIFGDIQELLWSVWRVT